MNTDYLFAVVGYSEIDGSWEESVTQHLNEEQTELVLSNLSPDAMNIVKVKIPTLG